MVVADTLYVAFVLGILAGLVVFAILWFPVRARTRSRCAAAERDVQEAIEASDQ